MKCVSCGDFFPGLSPAFPLRFLGAIFSVLLGLGQGQLSAEVIFCEPFSYSVGDPLTGQGGGTGFGGDWSGGHTTITSAPLAPGANSVAFGNGDPAFRELSDPRSTAGTTCYFAFLCSLSSDSGIYAGFSLFSRGTENMFFGIPSGSKALGFGSPTVKMSAPVELDTTYLVVYSLTGTGDEATGTLDIKMWVATDLGVDPTTLTTDVPLAESLATRANFSFDRIRLSGDYEPGAMKIQGLSAATTITEAVQFAVGKKPAVPVPH